MHCLVHVFQGFLPVSSELRRSLLQIIARLLQSLLRFPDHRMVYRPRPYRLPIATLPPISLLLTITLSF